MSVRTRMYMTATVQRNAEVREDDYGHVQPTDWQTVGSVACYLWTGSGRLSRMSERTLAVDTPQLLLPLGANIRTGDKITQIVDRLGAQLMGVVMVDTVTRKHTHLQATLKRVDG